MHASDAGGRRAWIFLALVALGIGAFFTGAVSGSNHTASLAGVKHTANSSNCRFISTPRAHAESDPFSGYSLWAQRQDAADELSAVEKKLPGDFSQEVDSSSDVWNPVPLPGRPYGQFNLEQIVVLSAIFLVLLIGCANLGGQMVSKTAAVRSKMTAERRSDSREQVVWRMLSESLMLVTIGGGLGLWIASRTGSSFWTAQSIFYSAGYPSPRLRMIILTLAICVIAGVIFGIIPAIRTSRRDPVSSRALRVRFALTNNYFARRAVIATELILMLVLLAGTGFLLGRSLHASAPTRAIPGRVTI